MFEMGLPSSQDAVVQNPGDQGDDERVLTEEDLQMLHHADDASLRATYEAWDKLEMTDNEKKKGPYAWTPVRDGPPWPLDAKQRKAVLYAAKRRNQRLQRCANKQ